jgi:hypothetical protein
VTKVLLGLIDTPSSARERLLLAIELTIKKKIELKARDFFIRATESMLIQAVWFKIARFNGVLASGVPRFWVRSSREFALHCL